MRTGRRRYASEVTGTSPRTPPPRRQRRGLRIRNRPRPGRPPGTSAIVSRAIRDRDSSAIRFEEPAEIARMILENQGQWAPAHWRSADGVWINDGGHSYRNPSNAFALPEGRHLEILDGGWGKKGKPLTRSTSGVADRTARTCGSFKARTDLVSTDTCSEFPFAETKEGRTDGAQCVEVIPNLGNGEWDTYVLGNSKKLDRTSPCVRAHATAADKQFADAQLTKGFADQRVIDADQFEVKFTLPDTGPHARCLDTTLLGALPNGNGWILNTTEPVAHVNKTTTPLGPPGQRPTQAQACLDRTAPEGTDAQGDIPGWQDAEKFKADNSLTNGQARCHLIPKVTGGRGIQVNLVPCWQSGMNTGTPSMRTFETMAQKMIRGSSSSLGTDDAVFYQVTPVYNDDTSTIPVGVTMNAKIEQADGTTEELFPNVYVPNTLKNTGLYNLGN
ncbi:DNA/RNA non-specific endonuclease [Streptomyces europaeiscabiei]|uniref:DNA/RNA non-specific endonuclease n=1 Tax=Streptomyces europaeiscabiei TaxID=146819 RepID=UPI002E1824C9|nr:DNA/RNA non-specific endonuclease [Streptomyces europaeiscabiei]